MLNKWGSWEFPHLTNPKQTTNHPPCVAVFVVVFDAASVARWKAQPKSLPKPLKPPV